MNPERSPETPVILRAFNDRVDILEGCKWKRAEVGLLSKSYVALFLRFSLAEHFDWVLNFLDDVTNNSRFFGVATEILEELKRLCQDIKDLW